MFRCSTSEWTALHSQRPASWPGVSHTASSFLLLPTKLCCANFRGGPRPAGQGGKPVSIPSRQLTSEWTALHSQRPASRLGVFCIAGNTAQSRQRRSPIFCAIVKHFAEKFCIFHLIFTKFSRTTDSNYFYPPAGIACPCERKCLALVIVAGERRVK